MQYSDEVDGIQFRGRHFYVPEGSEEKLRDMFKEFYRHRGKVFIKPRVQRFAQMMGISVEAISIIDLKNRWASCSVNRPKVNFNWKIMMAPMSVINYLTYTNWRISSTNGTAKTSGMRWIRLSLIIRNRCNGSRSMGWGWMCEGNQYGG